MANYFLSFSIDNAGELPLKNNDFVLKSGRLLCNSRYGLQWHKEPMSIWSDWLEPFVGRLFEDAEVKVTKPPAFWCDGEGDDGVELPKTPWAASAQGAEAAAVRQLARRPSCHLLELGG